MKIGKLYLMCTEQLLVAPVHTMLQLIYTYPDKNIRSNDIAFLHFHN